MSLPTIVPMIGYEDASAAADWLQDAFGFVETPGTRFENPDGTLGHVELRLGEGVVFLATPTPDYRGPRRHAEACEVTERALETPLVVDGLHVQVDDVDAHHDRARAAGARILSPPEVTPVGERIYRVEDLEGHRWMFAQVLDEG